MTNSKDDGDYWYSSACNIAINFHDSGWTTQEWSSYVAVAANQMEVEIPYSVTQDPEQFSIVRYSNEFTKSDWESNRWAYGTDYKWGEVKDVTYADNAHVYFNGYSSVTVGVYAIVHSSQGGGTNTWGDKMNLDNIKLNVSNHCEYYSDSVSMIAGEQFGMKFNGDWYNTVTLSDYVSSKFTGGNGSDIVCSTAGTYAFYFDSYSKSLYITDPDVASADEWAEDFVKNINCLETYDAKPSNWDDYAADTSFGALSNKSKKLFVDATASNAENATYIQKAAFIHDMCVAKYEGCSVFMKYTDSEGEHTRSSVSAVVSRLQVQNNNYIPVIVIASSMALVTILGAALMIKRRKEDR